MLDSLPPRVSIYEVSPRDGLQNEATPVDLASKKLLIESLIGAGLKRIEVSSFVSPRWVPQLADAESVLTDEIPPEGVRFSALCPNSKGLERAMSVGLKEIAIFLSSSETHNHKKLNRSTERSLDVYEELVALALEANIRVRAYVSTVWGCPYEGTVPVNRALSIAQRLLEFGCYEISLGDTIGVGTPRQTRDICQLFASEIGVDRLALHLHDTRGTALANALVGLECGFQTFDASVAGIGGCPYAPGAAGNLATEDLTYMLDGLGIETGIHLPALVEAGRVAARILHRPLPGKVHQAGLPRRRRPS